MRTFVTNGQRPMIERGFPFVAAKDAPRDLDGEHHIGKVWIRHQELA